MKHIKHIIEAAKHWFIRDCIAVAVDADHEARVKNPVRSRVIIEGDSITYADDFRNLTTKNHD